MTGRRYWAGHGVTIWHGNALDVPKPPPSPAGVDALFDLDDREAL